MFNKLMKGKRGTRKVPRSDANEPARSRAGAMASSVTVNHVSRAAAPASSSQASSSSAPSAVPPAQFEQLPLFRDVPSSDDRVTAITNLFLRKLRICSIIFDFSDCLRSPREKEAKRQTLLELVDFIQSNNCGRLPENVQAELVRTVSVNIFRGLPPAAHENTGTVDPTADPEEEETYLDPAWPHLQLIYELLLRYIVSTDTDTKVAKRFVNHSFILKLLDLFESEDPREREYLKTIVHRIYGKFMVHRPLIRNANNNIFYRFAFETERHSGVVELLEILGSIISGFAMPMKEEHKLFLMRALIPLHKPKTVGVYHSQLTYCVTLFVEKDYKLADPVIRGLLKYWPVTNPPKEVLFIGELEEVLEATHPAEFRKCMVPLFKQIARCLNSAHFQVAERALFLWNNDHIVDLIAQNRSVIFPIIFEALERNIQNHWNQAVNGLTGNVRKMFQEMDGKLFEECRNEYIEKETKAREIEEKRQLAWRQLETLVENQTMKCC